MSGVCNTCGGPVDIILKSTGAYRRWCSNKCMGADPTVLEKKRKTNLDKFGGHPMQSQTIISDRKAAYYDKHGCDNPFGNVEVKAKIQETNEGRYGCKNPSNNATIIEKIRTSAVNRYATTSGKDTVMTKRKMTCMELYGVEWSSQHHLSEESMEKLHDVIWLQDQHFVQLRTIADIAKELGCSPTPIFDRLTIAGTPARRFSISTGERELFDFVCSLTTHTVAMNVRDIIYPKELDIYVAGAKFAIEFNGTFWHSECHGKDRDYHLSKTMACSEQGIKLLHILDIEWETKRKIVESRIQHQFGLSDRIFARKCDIRVLSHDVAIPFLNDNHIQGGCPASLYVGLYHNDELVAVSTFAKSRYNKNVEWELVRYCTKTLLTIVGGASKLFKWFIKEYNPTSIISYADRRWSTGGVYTTLGFTLAHNSTPNYFYFHRNEPEKLMSRVQFQKHKLKEKLVVFDATLTEWDNMKNNGYDRVWDCGNMVFIWDNK